MPLKATISIISQFPLKHMIAAGVCVAVIAGLASSNSDSNTPERQLQTLRLPVAESIAVSEVVTPAAPIFKSVTVKSGDTLSDVFNRENLNVNDMYALLKSGKEGKRLARLTPNETFSYLVEDGSLQAWYRHSSALKTIKFTKADKGYSNETTIITPETRLSFKAAVLDSNLFKASAKIGLPQKVTLRMAGIFGGVMDFVYDPRKGDTFSVLYEELYVEGEFIGTGNIIAASYNNKGELHEAYYYENSAGDSAYYSPKGISMRKAFLRAPVDFTRISSSFNPNRLHPIFKTKRPHRGIDYAAPRGTPVFSAGDGRVVTSGYNKASGNYVVVQHGPRYQTKYLHLNRRSVKKGQRVSQGQVLGTVGSTGYATGPHLHYEFLLDGTHRNPRTILSKLPKAKAISSQEKAQFLATTQPISEQFAAYQRTAPFLIASAKQKLKKPQS